MQHAKLHIKLKLCKVIKQCKKKKIKNVDDNAKIQINSNS